MVSRTLAATLLGLGACGFAQGLHLGLKAGVPATAYFETGRLGASAYSAATRRYVVGISTEWRAARGFGFEVDALYRRMGYVAILPESALDAKGHSWDFPFLVKRRFGSGARPYVAGGGVWRYIGPVRARGQEAGTPIETTEPPELRKRHYSGVAAAAGLELGPGRWRLLPEFRYTRWTTNIDVSGKLLRLGPNQAEFLLGLLF